MPGMEIGMTEDTTPLGCREPNAADLEATCHDGHLLAHAFHARLAWPHHRYFHLFPRLGHPGTPDNDTVFGALQSGAVGAVLGDLVVSPSHLEYLEFSSPTARLTFSAFYSHGLAVHAEPGVWAKLRRHLFSLQWEIWAALALLWLPAQALRIALPPSWQRAGIAFAQALSVTVVLQSYNQNVKVEVIQAAVHVPPFADLSELLHLIRSHRVRLLFHRMDDYTFRLVNDSKTGPLAEIAATFPHFPPVFNDGDRGHVNALLKAFPHLVYLDTEESWHDVDGSCAVEAPAIRRAFPLTWTGLVFWRNSSRAQAAARRASIYLGALRNFARIYRGRKGRLPEANTLCHDHDEDEDASLYRPLTVQLPLDLAHVYAALFLPAHIAAVALERILRNPVADGLARFIIELY